MKREKFKVNLGGGTMEFQFQQSNSLHLVQLHPGPPSNHSPHFLQRSPFTSNCIVELQMFWRFEPVN